MKSRFKLCFKTAWLTAAAVALLMATHLCSSTEAACFDAGETMLLLMVIMSFPTGILSIFFLLFFFGFETGHSLSDHFTVWLVMTIGGYLQWFVLVPRWFTKPELTLLNLGQRESLLKAPATFTPPISVRQSKRTLRTSAFDSRGRTPLERVIARRL